MEECSEGQPIKWVRKLADRDDEWGRALDGTFYLERVREQQVYSQQSATRASSLLDGMMELLRSIREERLADFSAQLERQELDSQLRAIDELDQKQELAFARAKDALSQFKATMK